MEFNRSVNNHNLSQDEDDDDIEEISKELKKHPSPPAPHANRYDQNNSHSYNQTQNSSAVSPATSNIPLSSSDEVEVAKSPTNLPSSRIDNIKAWSFSSYKFTKQLIYERLGQASKTVDVELESQIQTLRDTHQKYLNILRLTKTLASNLNQTLQTQKSLGDMFSQLSLKNPELHEEFTSNSETQRILCKNGEILIGALNFFISNMSTLCNKTIDDTLITINNYEVARVEFDAYKADLESIQAASSRGQAQTTQLEDAQQRFKIHKEKYEGLRSDVSIKMKFLDENRVKVMQKQLALFHNAVASYYAGNQQALESTIKQFNIRLKPPTQPSWLEEHK